MRLGDIEYRIINNHIEIIKWYKNDYYGHENDYIKDGDFYHPTYDSHISIHKSCFEYPESCYVIATIDIKEEPAVNSVGLRAFELTDEDYKNFREIVKLAYNFARELYHKYINN